MRLMTRYAAVLAFFAVALVPVVLFGVNGAWPGKSPPALARPTPFPERVDSELFRSAERWFNDRIGLRFRLIYLGARLQVAGLKRSINKNVYFGQNGWVFWADSASSLEGRAIGPAALTPDARGQLRFRTDEIESLNRELRTIRDQLAACGKTIVFVFAPHKQSIYPEQLFGARATFPATRLDDLLKRIEPDLRSMIVDVRPSLRAAKAAGVQVYMSADTHWNGIASVIVYKDLVDAINKLRPVHRADLASFDYFDVAVAGNIEGDLGSVLHVPGRFIEPNFEMHPRTVVPIVNMSRGADGHLVYDNPDGEGSIMVSGDSFSLLFTKYLARHFKRVEHHGRAVGSAIDGEVIAQYRPDVVVIELVERYMPMMLIPPKNLDRACAK